MAAELPQKIPARRGFSVSYGGRLLLSQVDPIRQAERLVHALLPAKSRTLYFCPSPLLGYGLTLFAQQLPESSAILCIEADKILYEWTCKNSEFQYRGNIVLLHAQSPASLCRLVREHWGPRVFRRLEELHLSAAHTLHTAFYETAADLLRRDIALAWENAMTLTHLGRLYARNLFRNLPLLQNAPSLRDIQVGSQPLLVAGAGPSLNPLLDALQHERGVSPAIIAVDTALPALVERGIKPLLTVALEAQHWNLGDFTGCGTRPLSLAMDISALPAQARFAGGRPYWFWTPWTPLRFFDRLSAAGLLPDYLPPLGSVGLYAAALALKLSTGPVILCGLDFSFTLDNYHTRGSPSHRAALRRGNRLGGFYYSAQVFKQGSVAVRSKSGAFVRSDPAMRRYHALFQAEFAGNPRLYEIEGSGLPLEVTVLTQEEALRLLLSAPHAAPAQTSDSAPCRKDCGTFLQSELARLCAIRAVLRGEQESDTQTIDRLIDEADYLWAHFPDCAAAGGRRPPVTDISFLKRLRAELDPFIRLLERSVQQAAG